MFRERIERTPFTSEAADAVFNEKIVCNSYMGDDSYLSSLRAFLGSRIGEDKLDASIVTRAANRLSNPSGIAFWSGVGSKDRHCHSVILVAGSNEEKERCFGIIRSGFRSVFPNYKEMEKVFLFFKPHFQVLCYTSEDLRSSVVFADAQSARRFHSLQACIPHAMRWYFEDGMTDLEKELGRSLLQDDKDKYLEALRKIADGLDFRSYGIRAMLTGFERSQDESRLASLRNETEVLRQEVTDLIDRIRRNNAKARENDLILLGLRERLSNHEYQDSEIMELFLRNKGLSLRSVHGDGIDFYVSTRFSFFDTVFVERALNNEYSDVYQAVIQNAFGGKSHVERFLRGVFVEEEIQLWTCAEYTVSLSGSVYGCSNGNFPVEIAQKCLPNPHIYHHSCLGGYAATIEERLADGDMVGAVTQCVASCSSLDWSDGVVLREFIRDLNNAADYLKCVELPDGRMVTPIEATDWLEAQDEKAKEEE